MVYAFFIKLFYNVQLVYVISGRVLQERMKLMKRYLILEDGTVYTGEGFGATKATLGEVVFTTGWSAIKKQLPINHLPIRF